MLNLSSNNVNLFEKGTGGQSTPGGVLPVRVVDILLDDTHPEWDKYGKMEANMLVIGKMIKPTETVG